MRFMFRQVLLVLLLFFMLLSFAGAQELSAGSGGDIEGILKRGKLVVAITAVDQPPFYFVDKNGKL
ncbi:MAG: hypothetical protein IK050_05285, partial [Lachnospiraceae bacterium]|nr:hypothetical protein [Lachnospiraceae bacterium]